MRSGRPVLARPDDAGTGTRRPLKPEQFELRRLRPDSAGARFLDFLLELRRLGPERRFKQGRFCPGVRPVGLRGLARSLRTHQLGRPYDSLKMGRLHQPLGVQTRTQAPAGPSCPLCEWIQEAGPKHWSKFLFVGTGRAFQVKTLPCLLDSHWLRRLTTQHSGPRAYAGPDGRGGCCIVPALERPRRADS